MTKKSPLKATLLASAAALLLTAAAPGADPITLNGTHFAITLLPGCAIEELGGGPSIDCRDAKHNLTNSLAFYENPNAKDFGLTQANLATIDTGDPVPRNALISAKKKQIADNELAALKKDGWEVLDGPDGEILKVGGNIESVGVFTAIRKEGITLRANWFIVWDGGKEIIFSSSSAAVTADSNKDANLKKEQQLIQKLVLDVPESGPVHAPTPGEAK
jgi:hypothetical protein